MSKELDRAKARLPRTRSGIIITFTEEGIHRWESAPDQVDFLRANHRHLFHVKCHLEVKDLDRDLEFFTVKTHIRQRARMYLGHFSPSEESCESMAQNLAIDLKSSYPTLFRVEVWEDGENGGFFEWLS